MSSRHLWLWVALAALLCGSLAHGQDWTGIDDKVKGSIFRLEASHNEGDNRYLCSAVQVADDLVLTAAHCIPKDPVGRSIAIGGKDAALKNVNWVLDLAVLKVNGLGGKVIQRRPSEAPIGTPVAAVGHGFGAPRLKYTFGHISDTRDDAILLQLGAPQGSEYGIFVDAVFIPGDSGGAVVDLEGRLVSIIQAKIGSIGIAIKPQQFEDFIQEHLPKRTP